METDRHYVKVSIELDVETERETDGRWLADVPRVPGAMAYGDSKESAVRRALAVAVSAIQESWLFPEAG